MAEVDSPLTFAERMILASILLTVSPFVAFVIVICGALLTAFMALSILIVPFVVLATDVFVEVKDAEKVP